jgi:hypothetical protein
MPWFKVDDKLHDHHKTRQAGRAAMGVWVLAGSWSMDNRTDGFIPEGVLSRWGSRSDARRLVVAGLWHEGQHNGERGWRFHDWTRFQPSAAVTAATKAKEAEAGIRGNHKRWHVDRGITDPDCEYCYRVPDGEPDQVPETAPESGAIRPVPVPEPHPHTVSPNGETGSDVALVGEANTQTLVAEWIDHCAERPPGRVIGQVSRELKTMLDEGIDPTRVRTGLAEWNRRGLHPATLPSVVHELSTPQQRNGRQAETTGIFDRAAQRMGITGGKQ